MRIQNRLLWAMTAFWLVAGASSLFAQTAPAPPKKPAADAAPAASPAPVSADPGETTATFGDWVLRCQRVGAEGKQIRVCEVAQTLLVQGQQAPIAQIAIGRIDPKAALRLTVVLPTNILIGVAPKADLDAKDGFAVALSWVRCTPGGCFADAEMGEDALKHWRAQGDHARLQFTNAGGQALVLPFSLRGLPQALDAYLKS